MLIFLWIDSLRLHFTWFIFKSFFSSPSLFVNLPKSVYQTSLLSALICMIVSANLVLRWKSNQILSLWMHFLDLLMRFSKLSLKLETWLALILLDFVENSLFFDFSSLAWYPQSCGWFRWGKIGIDFKVTPFKLAL